MSERKLSTIQKIVDIKSIDGADKIELAFVKGWQVVCKKNEFKVGDFVVYIEIDSQVPDRPEFEFLRERKFRVRTIRLRKQLSQGLIVPIDSISDLRHALISLKTIEEGDDVTELLGITKYDPQAQEEKALSVPKHQNKVLRYLMNFKAFRTVYLKLNQKETTSFPSTVSKTDEESIQNCAEIIMNNFDKSFYVTEKCEGSSVTFLMQYERSWGFKQKVFGVCSRNIWLKTKDNSKYWQMAEKYDIKKILMQYDYPVSIQAEMIGTGIQGNIYNLPDIQIRVFNVTMDGERCNLAETAMFCQIHNLPMVPVLDNCFIPSEKIKLNDRPTIVKWLLDYSNGTSVLHKTMREGVVMRINDNTKISFKVRSPDYLIKHEE